MKIQYFVLLFLALLLTGCEDEQAVFETEYLLPGQWQLTDWYDDEARDLDNDGEASVNLYSQWNGCSKNSIIEFSTNSDFEFISHSNNNNPGCTSLNVNDYQLTKWELPGDGTIVLTGNGFTKSYEIITLENELLIIRQADLLVNSGDTPSNFTGGYLRFARYSNIGNK